MPNAVKSLLPQHFHTPDPGCPSPEMIVSGEKWRVQVLTDRLLRVEWSPSGSFEDRATQIVVNRTFDAPDNVVITRVGDGVKVSTPFVTLDYDGQEFTAHGLSATVLVETEYGGTWRWGVADELQWVRYRNLRGTARTLDNVDGEIPLEHGIMDGRGIAPLYDESIALTSDGWVSPREEGSHDVYIFAYGYDFRGAIRDYYRLTGAQPVIPRHALGNWWSRYHRYTQDEYLQLMDTFEEQNIPLSVAVIDMDWHLVDIDKKYGSGWTGFTWNRDLFPDPKELARDLHERGLLLTLNLHPADGIRAYEEAYPRIAKALGRDTENGKAVAFDVTDPTFMAAYFKEVLGPMEDDGVDFWWVDWQQGTHTAVPGLDPLWILNHMHVLDNANRKNGRGITLSRYAGPGSHRYPVGFSGDTIVTWESLKFQPYYTSTASNIGYGWWSHDIGGHMMGIRDAQLSTRWVQYGVFSPILRLHSTNNPFTSKEPWLFAAPYDSIQADYLRLRHRLVPYLHSEQVWGHEARQPLVTPVYWDDPAANDAWYAGHEYFFGRQLLVASIIDPIDEVTSAAPTSAWLPAGEWVDIFSGLPYSGGRKVNLYRRLDEYPVFARRGAVIPLAAIRGVSEAHPGVTVDNPAEIEVIVVVGANGSYELIEDDGRCGGVQVRTRFDWDDSSHTLTVTPVIDGNSVDEVLPPQRHYSVRIVGVVQEEASLWGASDTRVDATKHGVWEEGTGNLVVDLGVYDPKERFKVRVGADGGNYPWSATMAGRIHRILSDAQCNVDFKPRLAQIVQEGTGLDVIAALGAYNVPASVAAAITEVITARS